MAGGRKGVWTRVLTGGAVVLGGASLLGACGSSSSSTTTTTTTTTDRGSVTTAGAGDQAARLSALAGDVRSAQKSTFQAVYTSTGDSTSTVTLAQSPPKQLFSSTDSSGSVTSLVNTGTATYSCSGRGSADSAVTCTAMRGRAATAALSGVIAAYNGSTALTIFKAWQSALAARIAGASLTFTHTTIAGQPSTCADWSRSGDSATYCVTSSGVLAKVQTSGSRSGSNFVLTSYTNSPPASAFTVPAGATVVTLPKRVSAS